MLNEETQYLLKQIIDSIDRIESNVATIDCEDDFYLTPGGMLRLESSCMLLIAIGEALKGVDKLTKGELLVQYPEIDWKGAKGLRDIIAHHYFDIDGTIVFNVAKTKLPEMKQVIERILHENI